MTFLSADRSTARTRPLSFLRSVMRSVKSLVDGEVVIRREPAPQIENPPIGPVTCDLIRPDLINARDVFVVDYQDGLLFDQVEAVAISATAVIPVRDVSALMARLSVISADDALVIVNIDTINDMDQAVESLLALKSICPDVPVVIASTTFSTNNFSMQRRPITDASLRLPCSCAALSLAIEASVYNNQR